MRIPTSVIVMSLLTAAPFGLGIHETLTKKKQPDVEEFEPYDAKAHARRDREALAEYEREMAREAEERARKREAKLAVLDRLFGTEKASMGTLFAGVKLGNPEVPEDIRRTVGQVTDDGLVDVDFQFDDTLSAVFVQVLGRDYDPELGEVVDICDKLRTKLVKAWGPANNGTWLDPSIKQRAHLDSDTCVLKFDGYLEPVEWVDALPLDAIGKTHQTFLENIKGASIDRDWGTFTLPGTGAGVMKTEVTTYAETGTKITSVRAATDADFDTVLAIRDSLSARLKKQPVRDEDNGAWVWKSRPAVQLVQEYDSNRITLIIGGRPE